MPLSEMAEKHLFSLSPLGGTDLLIHIGESDFIYIFRWTEYKGTPVALCRDSQPLLAPTMHIQILIQGFAL